MYCQLETNPQEHLKHKSDPAPIQAVLLETKPFIASAERAFEDLGRILGEVSIRATWHET